MAEKPEIRGLTPTHIVVGEPKGDYQNPVEIDGEAFIDIGKNGDLTVDFFYPDFRAEKQPRVTIGLCHVRAADSITVYFDGDRNGYVILMDKTAEEPGYMRVVEQGQEVAFVPAWNCDAID